MFLQDVDNDTGREDGQVMGAGEHIYKLRRFQARQVSSIVPV